MSQIDFYYNDLWNRVLDKIHESGQISEDVFNLYIKGSKLINISEIGAEVFVPDYMHHIIMTQNEKLIETCLEECLEQHIPLKLTMEQTQKSSSINIQNDYFNLKIDKEQRFDTFVIGKSNSQAHAAAITCATTPGSFYNPLFIYGNSGIGKTHLLNAIGNYVISAFPNKKVGFINGVGFIDALTKSIKSNNLDDFYDSFYSLDVLLVDDIQFIAGKPKTQEVFFTIFNNLTNNKKQVCITSDRSPDEINDLEERIISRFNRGLNVNIESPEFETRIEILKRKLLERNIDKIDEDVYAYIANIFTKDVRELEGAVNRLYFYFINFNNDNEDHISLKIAYEAFKNQSVDNKNELDISKIKRVVADYYNLSVKQIISATRTKNIAIPRHIAMYLCRTLLDAPYKEIGNEFGKRDHSTVINACEKVEDLIKKDGNYQKALNDIKSRMI
ncbi:MAG: chromosomal replication initiator protein DnaA [Erysipelotrichaceae bacterium]|nr:chromosomal replication initiator protein DnaA [Erysipelotrichaceae bacterium]